MRKSDKKTDFRHAIAIAGSAGLTLFGMTGLGVWTGMKIDSFLQLEHSWGLIFGGILGALWGMYGMIYQMIHNE